VTDYTATVANPALATTVTATTADSEASLTVQGVGVASGVTSASIPLAASTVIAVVVTAPDGTTTKTYSVAVQLKGWQIDESNIGLQGAGIDRTTLADYAGPNPIPAGTTVTERHFTTIPDLSAGNITLERCWIDLDSGGGGLVTASPNGPITLVDCDVDAQDAPVAAGDYSTVAYYTDLYSSMGDALLTVRRCNVYGTGMGAHLDGPTLIENTYIHGLRGVGNPGTNGNHVDGLTRRGGTEQLTVRNSRIDSSTPGNTTGDLFLQTTGGTTIDNVTIDGNLFDFAGNDVIMEAKDGGSYGTNKQATNNRLRGGCYCQNFMVPASPPHWDTWTDNYLYDDSDADGRGAAVSAP
jgi:hypothetical protein